MPRILGLIFSFLLLIPQFSVGSISLENLDAQEDFVIYHRLKLMLGQQSRKMAFCPATIKDQRSRWLPLFNPQLQKYFFSFSAGKRKEMVLQLIENLKLSRNLLASCKDMNKNISSVKKSISLPPTLGVDRLQFLKELAPACFPVASKGSLSGKDTNACFAGDRLMMQDLTKGGLDFPFDSLALSEALLAAVIQASADKKKSLDLYNVFLEVFPDRSIKDLFTLLATFVTSGNSGLTGWLQGIEDRLLVADLNNNGLSSELIFGRSKLLQRAKIYYIQFRDLSDANKMKLTLFGNDVTNWNRHNFMASYLGCRDIRSFKTSVANITFIGQGYEAKDFFSHMIDGNTYKNSIQNFNVDSHRYTEGARLGHQSCH